MSEIIKEILLNLYILGQSTENTYFVWFIIVHKVITCIPHKKIMSNNFH